MKKVKSDRGRGLEVVVVEDDPTFLHFWERILKELGIKRFRLIPDPGEAQKLLSTTKCNLLISDVVMPLFNGFQLAHVARDKNPDCNIILTTGYRTDLSHFNIDSNGFHLLHKPYTNLSALKTLIRHLLDHDSPYEDISEDSFSENKEYPQVMEWKL